MWQTHKWRMYLYVNFNYISASILFNKGNASTSVIVKYLRFSPSIKFGHKYLKAFMYVNLSPLTTQVMLAKQCLVLQTKRSKNNANNHCRSTSNQTRFKFIESKYIIVAQYPFQVLDEFFFLSLFRVLTEVFIDISVSGHSLKF